MVHGVPMDPGPKLLRGLESFSGASDLLLFSSQKIRAKKFDYINLISLKKILNQSNKSILNFEVYSNLIKHKKLTTSHLTLVPDPGSVVRLRCQISGLYNLLALIQAAAIFPCVTVESGVARLTVPNSQR